jgi:hypothetical protein
LFEPAPGGDPGPSPAVAPEPTTVFGPSAPAPEPTVVLGPGSRPQHAVPPAAVPGTTPESAAELTSPLPRVQPHQPEHLTVGLPLLDLLAPQQPRQTPQPEPAQPFRPLSGYDGYGSYSGYPQPQQQQPPRQPTGPRPRPPMKRDTKLVIGAGAGVLLLAVLGLWALGSSSDDPSAKDTSTGRPPSTGATSAVRVVEGFQFTQNAARNDTDCVANSYGKVAEFFQGRPCASLDRRLYLSTVDGRATVVSVAVVRMPDEAGAAALKDLVDTSGTGNVADLLRAGVQVPGGPAEFSSAGYASTKAEDLVIIAEADFADPQLRDESLLDRLSTAALQLGR